MDIPQTDIDLMEGYLDGSLGAEAYIRFNQRYEEDEHFRAKFAAYEVIYKTLNPEEYDEYSGDFDEYEEEKVDKEVLQPQHSLKVASSVGQTNEKDNAEEKDKQPAAKTISLYRQLAKAMGILFIVSAGLTFWSGQHFSGQALASKYSEMLNTGSTAGDDSTRLVNIKTQIDDGNSDLFSGNYKKAKFKFSTLEKSILALKKERNLKSNKWTSDYSRIKWGLLLIKLHESGANSIQKELEEYIANSGFLEDKQIATELQTKIADQPALLKPFAKLYEKIF